MTKIFEQLIIISPILILILTLLVLLLSISWRRNYLINNLITIIGLIFALISLFFVKNYISSDITDLLRIDLYSIFYTILIILSSIIICIFAYDWLLNFPYHKEEFYLLIIIATIGAIILSSSINFLSLFIGLELISLTLSGIIGYSINFQKFSLEASLKYTILSAITSSFILFGIALIYSNYGMLNFIQIGKLLDNNINVNPTIIIGLGMLIIGISFKLSLVPFHLWTADVYQGSPLLSSAFLATVSKIAIFSVIMRLFIYIPINKIESIKFLIYIISFISILIGNIMAISENNIKRILGYSSIANFGYLFIVLITLKNNNFALETAGIFFISYLLSNLGIFGIMNLISNPSYKEGLEADSIYHYRGLFWNNPLISVLMTIMIISLAGIPMTLGFISKFYIISLNIYSNMWFLLISIIIGSALGFYYYLKIIISLYLYPPKFYFYNKSKNFWIYTPNGIIIIILAFLLLLLGVYPELVIKLLGIFFYKN